VLLEGECAALSQQLAAERSRVGLLGGHVKERSHDNVPLQVETIVRLNGEQSAQRCRSNWPPSGPVWAALRPSGKKI
jgi:hypothetical protein